MDDQFDYGAEEVETLQMQGGGDASAEHVKQAAAQGLQGQSARLPHLEKIQQAFGAEHDLSSVQAHVGGRAQQASRAMGAKAYTTGNAIAFGEQPNVRLAAHEAAHVVQQRAGVSLSKGVGQSGDKYEERADKVADRVASGRSAADLLPSSGGGGGGGAAVQRYQEYPDGPGWRSTEDFKVCVSQDAGGGGQLLLATQDHIASANSGLATAGTKGSFIRLEEDGRKAQFGDNVLHAVKPVFHDPEGDGEIYAKETALANKKGNKDATGDASDKFALYSDCGRSSRVVMGSRGEGAKATVTIGGVEMETSRAYNPQGWTDPVYREGMKAFLKDKNKAFLKEGVHYSSKNGSVTYNRPKTGQEAKQMWGQLEEDGKDAFAKELGIDEYADPDVGGGYTMATGGDLPGFKKMGDMTWNFHWAGVIMKVGADNITLENYAIMFEPTGDPDVDKKNRERAFNWTNKDWVYQMYGKKEGQTFHEQHLESGTHGSEGTSFAVKI